jgi:subfamily B ATP-binding cassette protein MsbA
LNDKQNSAKDPWYGLRFLSPYLKTHKNLFLVILVSMILVAVTSALSAYIFKHILNDIFISKDEQMLIILPLIVIAIFLTRGIARFTSTYLTTKIGVSVANGLRAVMFERLIRAEYHAMQKVTTGDINALIIQTALNIQNTVAKSIPQLIISSLTILALLTMIFYTDWRLSLYAIMVALFMVIPVKILGKGVKRHTSNSETMITELSNRINESFNHFDLVKVYNKEQHEKKTF